MAYVKSFYLIPNDINAIIQGITAQGVENGVLNELQVVANSPQGMSVIVKTGTARFETTVVAKTSQTVVNLSASETKPRKDIIVIDSSGTISAQKGTAADANPTGQSGPATKAPEAVAIPANSIILAEVWIGAGVTAIYDADITDRRVILCPVLFTPSGAQAYDLIYFDGSAWARLSKGSAGTALSALTAGYSFKDIPTLDYEWAGIYLRSIFDCISAWDPNTSGSGSITISSYSCLLDTGATNGSYAKIKKRPAFYARATPTWAKDRKLCVGLAAWPDVSKTAWIVTGQPGINRHFGFKISGASVLATVADGTTENTVNIGSISSDRQAVKFEALFTTGSKCDFYWDGVLKTTISTNLPTGTTDSDYLFYGWIENAVAASRKLEISEILVKQDP